MTLKEEIKKLRQKMIRKSKTKNKDLLDKDVQAISQKLDKKIVELMKNNL